VVRHSSRHRVSDPSPPTFDKARPRAAGARAHAAGAHHGELLLRRPALDAILEAVRRAARAGPPPPPETR
jgi:hypothetical protein